MHQFKDSEGREWSLSINVLALKKLKESPLAIDLLDDLAGMKRLANDTFLAIDVTYQLCLEACDKAGVSEESFITAFPGDGIECLLAELLDFFRRFRRQAEATLLEQILQVKDQTAAMAAEKANSPAMQQAIQRAMAEASQKIDQALLAVGNSSGNSPESQDLTPTPAHSAS